jgi:hypothetical protein
MERRMIHPEQRGMLTDALTPPSGFVFDSGVATTYSLDLITLLTLPLHLAWLGSADDNANQLDPLRIVESLRRTASRLTVYCEKGKMQIPRMASPLLSLMEGMVHQAQAGHGGAFHPKVWLLKFLDPAGIGLPKLRLIVLSRNLTDDRSWDVCVNLDGTAGSKIKKANRPLHAFLEKIQGLSEKVLTPGRQADMDLLMHDALRCDWELPANFESIHFHVLGLGRRPAQWLPQHENGLWDELGVVSPFIRGNALKALAALSRKPLFLVSLGEELDQLKAADSLHFPERWVLDAQGDTAEHEDDASASMKGLHAKVYAAKKGWNTHLFLGSANATDAALLRGCNVEFMVELVGRSSKVGLPGQWVSAVGMGNFLVPYVACQPTETEETLRDKKRLEELRKGLCNARLHLKCSQQDSSWLLQLLGGDELEHGGATVHAWPLSVKSGAGVLFAPGKHGREVSLGLLQEQELTSFIGFSLRLGKQKLDFALDLKISGLPETRDLAILRGAVADRAGFTRYLLLLLGNWNSGGGGGKGSGKTGGSDGGSSKDSVPLFEMLAWAFAHDPERLVHVTKMLDSFRAEADGTQDEIVPADFQLVWQTFEQALNEKGAR